MHCGCSGAAVGTRRGMSPFPARQLRCVARSSSEQLCGAEWTIHTVAGIAYSGVVDLRDLSNAEIEALRQLAIQIAGKLGAASPEDVAQEVLVKLTRMRSVPENLEAWVTVVARNAAIDEARKADRRPRDVAEQAAELRASDEWLRNSVPVSLAGMQAEAYEWLRMRLGAVFSDREIELMSFVSAGTPYDEIAVLMGYKDASVVKTTVSRIRKKADALDEGGLREFLNHPRMYGGGRLN